MQNLKILIAIQIISTLVFAAPVPEPKHSADRSKGRAEAAPATPSPIPGSITERDLPNHVTKRFQISSEYVEGNFCFDNKTPFMAAFTRQDKEGKSVQHLLRAGANRIDGTKIKGIEDDLKPPRDLNVSPDGGHVAANGGDRPLALYDLVTGEDKAKLLKPHLKGKEVIDGTGAFSESGRFWVISKSISEGQDRKFTGTFIVDLVTKKVNALPPSDQTGFKWLSDDGNYFSGKTNGFPKIFRKDGTVLYPKAGEPELDEGRRKVSTSKDGKTMALLVEKGTGTAVRIYQLPEMKFKHEYPSKALITDGPQLSPDGSYYLLSHVTTDAKRVNTSHYEFVETATGKVIAQPPQLTNTTTSVCPNGKLVAKKFDSETKEQQVDVIDPHRLLVGELPLGGYIPKLADEMDRSDTESAWKSLVRLKYAGISGKRTREQLDARKVESLPEATDKLLKGKELEAKLNSDLYAVREGASQTIAAAIHRANAVTYRTKIRPVLIEATKSKEIEVRKRAKPLLAKGDAISGAPSPEALEARLRFLDE